MATNLTICGWGGPGRDFQFCHASVRPARGTARYEPLLLTRDAAAAAARGTSWDFGAPGLLLLVWSTRLEGEPERDLHVRIEAGRLVIPEACPIEPSTELIGVPFGPMPVPEVEREPARCSGSGILMLDGFALRGGGRRVVDGLQAKLGRVDVGEEVERLAAAVAARSGLGGDGSRPRRLSVVDSMRRSFDGERPRLFAVSVVKPSLESTELANILRVARLGADLGIAFRLVLEARFRGTFVDTVLLELAAGRAEASHDAGTHVTDYRLTAFDGDGRVPRRRLACSSRRCWAMPSPWSARTSSPTCPARRAMPTSWRGGG